MSDDERCEDEMERFAAEHGIAALLDHLGLDGLANEVEQLRAKLAERERGDGAARVSEGFESPPSEHDQLAWFVEQWPKMQAERDALVGALRPFTGYDFHAAQHIAGLTHEGHALRALWVETVDELIAHVAEARRVLGLSGETWTGQPEMWTGQPGGMR